MPHRPHRTRPTFAKGISTVELILTIAVVALLATVSSIAVNNVNQRAQAVKLDADVEALNSAIRIYLASGGSLEGLTSSAQVLDKLKTSRTSQERRLHVGAPSGQMIDKRVTVAAVPADSWRARAIYQPASARFERVEGVAGVEFVLAGDLATVPTVTESRSHGPVNYAETSGWVWDHGATTNPGAVPGPSQFSTSPTSGGGASPGGGGEEGDADSGDNSSPEQPAPAALPTPSFSPPGGTYASADFPIAVTITNVPATNEARAEYRIGNAAWQNYTGGTLAMEPDFRLRARFISLVPESLQDSKERSARYRLAQPPRLPTPNFSVPSGSHSEEKFPLSVAITNLPAAEDAAPVYRLNGGAWQPYSGAVEVPMNSSLHAQFLAKDPESYRNSSERQAFYQPVVSDFSGSTSGTFHSIAGGPDLWYELSAGGTQVAHGDPVYILDGEPIESGDPSWMRFAGGSFSAVPPGETFKLGDLVYHNGNSYYDSHATEAKLGVVITMPDRGINLAFDLNFDLINTPNDPDDPVSSADYVILTNLQQNIPLEINEVGYRIELRFGATDSFGFSTSNQFHVYEGATGVGEILGTLVPQ